MGEPENDLHEQRQRLLGILREHKPPIAAILPPTPDFTQQLAPENQTKPHLLHRSLDWVFEYINISKLGAELSKEAVNGWKHARVYFIIATAAIIFMFLRGCRKDSKIDELEAKSSRQDDTIKMLSSTGQSNASIIQKLSTELLKEITEKNGVQTRFAIMEATPSTALNAYTNMIVMSSNANSFLKFNYDAPDYNLEINGKTYLQYVIDGAIVIRLKEERTIFLRILPLDNNSMSVDNLTVDFSAQLDITNLVLDSIPTHWRPQPTVNSDAKLGKAVQLEIVSTGTISSTKGFDITAFNISTNVPPGVVWARVDIYAPRTRGVKSIPLNFVCP